MRQSLAFNALVKQIMRPTLSDENSNGLKHVIVKYCGVGKHLRKRKISSKTSLFLQIPDLLHHEVGPSIS